MEYCKYCGRDSNNKGIANCIGIGLHSWTLEPLVRSHVDYYPKYHNKYKGE